MASREIWPASHLKIYLHGKQIKQFHSSSPHSYNEKWPPAQHHSAPLMVLLLVCGLVTFHTFVSVRRYGVYWNGTEPQADQSSAALHPERVKDPSTSHSPSLPLQVFGFISLLPWVVQIASTVTFFTGRILNKNRTKKMIHVLVILIRFQFVKAWSLTKVHHPVSAYIINCCYRVLVDRYFFTVLFFEAESYRQ